MSTLAKLAALALALFLTLSLHDAAEEYSDTHLLVHYTRQKYYGTETDTGQIHVGVGGAPFFGAQNVHTYMVPLTRVQNEAGGWEDVLPMDNEIQEGTSLHGWPDPITDDKVQLWFVICSEEPLATWEEIDAAMSDKYLDNYVAFYSEPGNGDVWYPVECK